MLFSWKTAHNRTFDQFCCITVRAHLSLIGCTVVEPDVFLNLVRHSERADVSPLVAETYPLERIADAQTAFLANNHVGKIVLTIGSSS